MLVIVAPGQQEEKMRSYSMLILFPLLCFSPVLDNFRWRQIGSRSEMGRQRDDPGPRSQRQQSHSGQYSVYLQ